MLLIPTACIKLHYNEKLIDFVTKTNGVYNYVPLDVFHLAGAVACAATGGFIGGVLLTAAIAGVIALVVLCRAKRRGTTKLELVLSPVCIHIAALRLSVHMLMYVYI